MNLDNQDIMIYDVETKVFGKPDKDKDRLRVFICYSYKTNKVYFLKNKEDIQRIINHHKYLVGFNIFNYDNPILIREGIIFGKDKIMIDIYNIFKERASQMKIDKGMLGDILMEYSLDYISKTVGVADEITGKKKIDYAIFKKESWSLQEWEIVCDYGKQDVMVTKRLYEWLEQYFEAFKFFLYDEDVKRKIYLTSSLAKFTYKAICKEMKWNEAYASNLQQDADEEKIKGGYVSYPAGEKFENVKLLDFKSMYPHCMIQCNLYGMQSDDNDRKIWDGNGIWNVEGKYYSDELAGVGKLLKRWFADRTEYRKKGDKREYTLKIMLNTCFSHDTEIITIDGIKNIQECKVGDKVFSINKETGKTEIKEITATQIIKYSGDMVNFDNCNMNLMVTPDHNMIHTSHRTDRIYTSKAIDMYKKYVKYPDVLPIDDGVFEEEIDISRFADENCLWLVKLYDSYSQRKNKNLYYNPNLRMHLSLDGYNSKLQGKWFIQGRSRDIKIRKYLDIYNLMYFIGIYIAEGYCDIIKPKKYENGKNRGTTYRVNISQYNADIKNKIRKVLDKLGFRYSEDKRCFQICSKFLYDFVQQFGVGAENKNIPDWIFQYKYKILERLYEGMYDGDGTKSQNKYTTKSKKLRDDYIKLNMYLGYRCHYRYDGCWRIFRVGQTKNIPKNNFISKNNSDMVYCVTVKDNHTLMAGRNGRFQWTGQCYGILDTPYYVKTYNKVAAGDCTRLGRQWIKYARKIFAEEGYTVCYTDTDSCFIVDIFNDMTKVMNVKKKIIDYIKSTVPFPQDTFDMELDAELKYLYFFKGGDTSDCDSEELEEDDRINRDKGWMKKNYIMVTKNDKVIIKNLGIKKKSNSPLSKKIFWEYLVPQIKQGKSKFKRTYIRNLMLKLLQEDFTLAALRKEVGAYEQYEKTSPNSLSAQIAKEYGSGIHFLIPNNINVGVGKGKKYCTVDEFRLNKMKMEHIDLDNFWKELEYFITPTIIKNIFEYEEKCQVEQKEIEMR